MPLFERFLLLLTILIPYQIYIPVYGDKSITLFAVAAMLGFFWMLTAQIKHGTVRNSIRDTIDVPVIFYFLFWVCCCCAFFYSGNKVDALKHVFYLGLVIAAYMQFKHRSAHLSGERVVRVFLLASIPLAVMVIVVDIFKEHQ